MKKVHLIAIGGSVMHTLAIALKRQSWIVTGSDDVIYNPARQRLEEEKLCPETEGWHPDKIHSGLDMVILGKHAKADNPELIKAKEFGIEILSFPEFIFSHSRNKQRIVVCGSHGKTTITSMIMHVLNTYNRNFDYLVGASVEGFDLSVRLSEDAPMMIIEGDEYLSSELDPRPKFLVYQPHICIISGIEWDHINVFPTEADYDGQFQKLLDKLNKAATIVYNTEDPKVRKMVEDFIVPEKYFVSPYSTPKYKTGKEGIQVKLEGIWGKINVLGAHNISNMAAAWECCKKLSIRPEEFLSAIETFKGADKRLQVLPLSGNTLIIQDFAHAPSKVRASVKAVNEFFPDHNRVGVLELHTYSSLNKEFVPRYKDAMKGLSHSIILIDPEAMAIKKMPEMNPEFLKKAFGDEKITVVHTGDELRNIIQNSLNGVKDIVLLMSSGGLGGMDLNEIE